MNLNIVDLALISVTSGFCEEIFFRGLLQVKLGIILASIAFGMLHFPGLKYWFYVFWATASGIILGYLFIFTGSLWTPITAHAVNNFIGLMLLKNLNPSSEKK